MVVIETRVFTARVRDLFSDEDYRQLQLLLAARPDAGQLIPGTGGLRKVRWAASGRGKRGGARVIYFWHKRGETILMLFVFAKSERSDLSQAQKAALRRIVEEEYR